MIENHQLVQLLALVQLLNPKCILINYLIFLSVFNHFPIFSINSLNFQAILYFLDFQLCKKNLISGIKYDFKVFYFFISTENLNKTHVLHDHAHI
jgi:hypothetical protein